MAKKWTSFQLTDNMLKLLAIGHAKYMTSEPAFCGGDGAGHGSSSGRTGLYNRGLVDADHCINWQGVEAFEAARDEGW